MVKIGNLSFFDINGTIGQPIISRRTGNLKGYLSADSLIDEMDYFGIDSALVTHWEALKYHPAIGNKKLIEEIKGYHRFYPCWVIMPHHTGEMPEPKELAKEIIANDVKAIALFPSLCGFSLEDWSIKPLFKELQRVDNIIIIIEGYAGMDLHSLCSRYPKLKFVVSASLRKLYPLLQRFSNLYINMGYSYTASGVVEDICKRFGAERIIFGTHHLNLLSGSPVSPLLSPGCIPGSSMAMVAYADISEREKKMIAGGSLRKLLGIPSEPSSEYNFSGEIQRLAFQGEKLPISIIDSHFHLGPDIYSYKPGADLPSIIKMMETTGVSKLCINSSEAVWGGNHYQGNNYIASLCKKYPERFIGFAVINPNFNDTTDEIKRCIEELGLKGIKIHPRIHQCDLTDSRYNPVWEASEKYQIPILSHTGEGQFGSSPKAFKKISQDYPRGTFLLGHSGDNLEGLKFCIKIAKKRDNVYLGTSDVVFMHNGMLEYTVSQIGADKILFESDCPWFDFNYSLGIVLYARISEKDKAKILGLNMARIMKIKI